MGEVVSGGGPVSAGNGRAAVVGTDAGSGPPLVPVRDSAVRAWVEPHRSRRAGAKKVPWRPRGMADRVLVFDTETTTDFAQRLQFGVFRLHEHGALLEEGIFFGDSLTDEEESFIRTYADLHGFPVYTRREFVEIFYEEVYELGTLCVGYNLPFDISRCAVRANSGRGENRRKFRFKLSWRVDLTDI